MKNLSVIILTILLSFLVTSCYSSNFEFTVQEINDSSKEKDYNADQDIEEDEDAEEDVVDEPDLDNDPIEPDDEEEEPKCVAIDKTIVNDMGYDNYFAFEGVGPINKKNQSSRPDETMMSNHKIRLKEYPDKKFYQAYSFFQEDPENSNGPAIILIALGDPVGQMYGTYVISSFPLSWIDSLKELGNEGQCPQPFSSFTTVYNLKDRGNDILEICILGISALVEIDGNELPEGELQVCYDRNISFAVGEFFRFGVHSNLIVDKQAIVDMFSDIDDISELCFCQNFEGTETDCPE